MNKKIIVNKELAQKVIDVVTPGLCNGLGSPEPGKMCVEAAVNYACGLPHGDDPTCVGQSVRNFKICLNDSPWSSNKARAKGMVKIAIAQLGSNKLNQKKFEKLMDKEYAKLVWKAFRVEISKIVKDKKMSISNKVSKIGSISDDHRDCCNEHYDGLMNENPAFLKMKNDEYYTFLADICLTVLKKMKSPGCKYLYLLNKK